MNLEEFQADLAALQASFTAQALLIIKPYLAVPLSPSDWLSLLVALFGPTRDARWEASGLARDYFDSERARYGLGRHDAWLATYSPDEFEEAMTPHKAMMSRPDTTDNEAAEMVGDALREVQAGSRRTMITAAISDPAAGYARVDSKAPTCGFCAVLISRGAVYTEAQYRKNTQAFHRFCTCELVPVYSDDYPGSDQAEKYDAAYRRASKLSKDEGISLFSAMERVLADG